jgi:hypothetical protein
VANIWRFEVIGKTTALNLFWQFGIHYQTDMGTGSGEPSAERVLEELEQHYSTSGTSLNVITSAMWANNELTHTRVRSEEAPGSDDLADVFEHDVSHVGTRGTVSTDILPIELCVWIKLTTASRGRSARGGFHMPPQLAPVDLDGLGQWQSSVLAGNLDVMEAAVVDVLDDVFPEELGNGSLKPIIYSRTRRARAQTPFTYQVTGASAQPHARWLRRRGIAP